MTTRDCPTPRRSERDAIAEGTVMAGKYCLERLLGSGAQGWVWAARNLDLDVPVAIKLLRRDGADDPQPAQRLFREARSAARLGHPAIVRVFDLGEDADGSPFIVLERLQGETLADRLSRTGALDSELAVRTMLPIADALLATHQQGIVHRDVKPANVFLALNGPTIQPKLMDFGIARFVQGTGSSSGVTQQGAIVGTPSYVSPEQARGLSDVDHRSDMWSFCTTLYECMTLCLPFGGTTWPELCRAILADEPRTLFDAGVEEEALWRILRRGLAKAPEDRFANMLALGRELATWLLRRDVTDDVSGTSLEARWLREDPMSLDVARTRISPSPEQSSATVDLRPPGQRPLQDSGAPSSDLGSGVPLRGSTLRSLPRPVPGRPAARSAAARWLVLSATALSALGLGGAWFARASSAQAPPSDANDALTMAVIANRLPTAPAQAVMAVTAPPVPTPTVPTTAEPQRPLPPAVPPGEAPRISKPPVQTPAQATVVARARPAAVAEQPKPRVGRAAPPDLIDPYASGPAKPRSSKDESRLPSTSSLLGVRGNDERRVD